MINSITKDRISWWAIKARNEPDFYVRFILYWFCFNAWITYLSQVDSDSKAIQWFLDNDNDLMKVRDNFWKSSATQATLNELKNQSPVWDNRPGHENNSDKNLNDIDNVREVVWFIYQIRCNLFHGTKNPNDRRDSQLVENSEKIIGKWIETALI